MDRRLQGSYIIFLVDFPGLHQLIIHISHIIHHIIHITHILHILYILHISTLTNYLFPAGQFGKEFPETHQIGCNVPAGNNQRYSQNNH